MPITGTPQQTQSYYELTPGVGHLKNIGPLATSATEGLTAEDLETAAAYAKAAIDASLGGRYETSTWSGSTPPIISRIAELLGSAEVLDFKHARFDPASSNAYADSLRSEARFLLKEIRSGRLMVIAPGGTVQDPLTEPPNIARG